MSNINFIPEMPLTWLTCPVYAEGVLLPKRDKSLPDTNSDGKVISENIRFQIDLPSSDLSLTPFIFTIPLQLLSYHIAVMLGKDVDQPRNLAKSVTVE